MIKSRCVSLFQSASEILAIDDGQWHGPFESSQGIHFLRVVDLAVTPEDDAEVGPDVGQSRMSLQGHAEDVEAGSDADRAGLMRGDIILQADRKPVRSVDDVLQAESELSEATADEARALAAAVSHKVLGRKAEDLVHYTIKKDTMANNRHSVVCISMSLQDFFQHLTRERLGSDESFVAVLEVCGFND